MDAILYQQRFVKLASLVSLTVVLFVFCLPRVYGLSMAPYGKGFSIANVVGDSNLVVFGRVVKKEFVFREEFGRTTDISIDVREMIKGTPNAGEDHVKFMIDGGTGTDPNTGRTLTEKVSGTPEFELNETVLLFLVKSRRSELCTPHGGYYIFYVFYGKRPVNNGKVSLWYTLDNDGVGVIDLPVDLVIQIAKAAAKNYEAASRLENDIRAQIIFFRKLTDRLKREAQQIIDGQPQN